MLDDAGVKPVYFDYTNFVPEIVRNLPRDGTTQRIVDGLQNRQEDTDLYGIVIRDIIADVSVQISWLNRVTTPS